jgi:hypothetical protein
VLPKKIFGQRFKESASPLFRIDAHFFLYSIMKQNRKNRNLNLGLEQCLQTCKNIICQETGICDNDPRYQNWLKTVKNHDIN